MNRLVLGLAWLLASTANAAPGEASLLARQTWRRLVHGHQTDTHADCIVHWRRTPLALAAARLQAGCGATVWIDRRIDPSTRLTIARESGGAPLSVALDEVAEQNRWGVTRFGEVQYLGPRATSEQLLTRLANRLEQIESLPPNRRRVFRQASAVDWPKLTEPRSLIVSLLEGRGLSVEGAERVPHDRWGAFRLPPMPLADQLTLLLAGFDLDWAPADNGRAVALSAASAPQPVTAAYRLREGSPSAAEARAELGPDAQLAEQNNRLSLTGTIELHAQLATVLATANHRAGRGGAKKKSPTPQREQRFTLRVKDQPAAGLIRQLGKQVGFRVEIDKAAEAALADAGRVGFEVREATLDELLQAFAKAAGVTVTRRDAVVTVGP